MSDRHELERRTISLPHTQAAYIDELVERGAFSSASEVVRAGLRLLKERDAVIERWLREDVVPVYDRMQANPRRGIPAAKVLAELRTHASSPRHKSRAKVRT
jgi:antitoxin ParD1/3/4